MLRAQTGNLAFTVADIALGGRDYHGFVPCTTNEMLFSCSIGISLVPAAQPWHRSHDLHQMDPFGVATPKTAWLLECCRACLPVGTNLDGISQGSAGTVALWNQLMALRPMPQYLSARHSVVSISGGFTPISFMTACVRIHDRSHMSEGP